MKNNLIRMRSINKAIISFALLVFALQVMGQGEVSLTIGDPAPAIKYSKWIKGTPVQAYQDDRLYVLEFWATWCGPCIAAMPHLSELSKKYQDRATFIGVDVWEKVGDKPYESALPAVSRFVESSANRMSYDVIVDNNAQEMANLWLKPAGVQGIPTTFLVKKGKIVWIGHPIKLDSILDPIIAGRFDIAAFKQKYETQRAASLKSGNEMTAAIKAVQNAAATGEFDKAFLLVDEGMKKQSILWMVLPMEKFKILLNNFPEAQALKYANELMEQNKSFISAIASEICDKDGLSKEMYLFAAESFKKAVKENGYSGIYDKMALAYSKAGDVRSAIDAQEKAIAAAKEEVKDPKYGGRVFDYTITDYEETLRNYRKALR